MAAPRPPAAGLRRPPPSRLTLGGRLVDTRKKIHFKVIRSPGDLLQFIEELKESTKKVGDRP